MTNLEWIKTKATTEQIAQMLDRTVCEHCAYEHKCNMASLHYGEYNCQDGIMTWLCVERTEK